MHSPAIQAALNNLVETIRTSLMAEFLELLRSGKPAKLPAPAKKRATRSTKRTTKKAAPKATSKSKSKR